MKWKWKADWGLDSQGWMSLIRPLLELVCGTSVMPPERGTPHYPHPRSSWESPSCSVTGLQAKDRSCSPRKLFIKAVLLLTLISFHCPSPYIPMPRSLYASSLSTFQGPVTPFNPCFLSGFDLNHVCIFESVIVLVVLCVCECMCAPGLFPWHVMPCVWWSRVT